MKITESLTLLLAQAPNEGAPSGGESAPSAAPGGLMSSPLVMMLLIFVIFYFILIRPQKQKQKKLEEQRNALRSGDKVITAGGIHGLVTNVKAHSVTLKIADNVKVEFEKASIGTVISKDNAEPPEQSQEEEAEKTS
ncbi:MAG: preprotein translocase subunit YajC [Verrucomicrobiota bacterium]|nr:preprotein translocase subunit YajC [Verrucomicrobiota bacterium]